MNKDLFGTRTQVPVPEADTVNAAGGKAYSMPPEHQLAQYAVTGTFNNTYYEAAQTQLEQLRKLLMNVSYGFIARTAVYARKTSFMKDLPAFLTAYLFCCGFPEIGRKIFSRTIDNSKQLRNFVQFIRSGVFGKTSLATAPTNAIKEWFLHRTPEQLFKDSIGNDPSLADIIRLCHIKPGLHDAIFKYILGYKLSPEIFEQLPEKVKQFEAFKADKTLLVPAIDFRFLAPLQLTAKQWRQIALNANYHTTRMNLNTFKRHGVFDSKEIIDIVAERLSNQENITRNQVFPYQLFAAYENTVDIPAKIRNALQDAADISLYCVPDYGDNVYVCLDVSGSMGSPITGYRSTVSSNVRCIDVAALFAAAILRKNPESRIIAFDDSARDLYINPRDSLMTITKQMNCPGGSTNCAAALRHIAKEKDVRLVVMISDNESWFSNQHYFNSGTDAQNEWKNILARNPGAKLVCIDICPNTTIQVFEAKNVLNVGGFSDNVFRVIERFLTDNDAWVNEIQKIEI